MMRRPTKALSAITITASLFLLTGPAYAQSNGTETIVFMRHGEKPANGLGQLDCLGLNRALALPAVLAKSFGRPDAIFAPDPADQYKDDGQLYDYVRPLATIEPTAISLGMPINANIGVTDETGLEAALVQPTYHDKLIFVAWEHKHLVNIVRELLATHGGDAASVPHWPGDDFDSLYVIRLHWTGDTAKASFLHAYEGLNGQAEACPQ